MNVRCLLQRAVAASGVLNNVVLILLIVFKSPKQLGAYKYLMMYISIFEMFYSILDFVTVPEIYSKGSVYLVIIDSNLAIPLPTVIFRIVGIIFCSLFGVSLIIFAFHFMYRYLVITGSSLMKKNQFAKVMGLIGITILVGFAWSFIAIWLFSPSSYSDRFISEHYLAPQGMSLTEVTYVGTIFHPINGNGKKFINWDALYGILLLTSVIVVESSGSETFLVFQFASFVSVLYFGIKVYQKMNEMIVKTSAVAKNLQSQLFWSLVFQTLIPVLLMHLPVSVVFLSSMLDVSVEIMGEIPSVSILFYPALDPIPSFFIIKNYKNAIIEFFWCMKGRRSKKEATVKVRALTIPT